MSRSAGVVQAPVNVSSPVRSTRLAVSGGLALAFNLIAFGLGSLAGATWNVGQPYAISAWAVAGVTVGAFAAGGLVTGLVARRRPGLQRLAAWIGLGVGLISMVSLVNAADLATGLALGSMHLATSVAWFVALSGKSAT